MAILPYVAIAVWGLNAFAFGAVLAIVSPFPFFKSFKWRNIMPLAPRGVSKVRHCLRAESPPPVHPALQSVCHRESVVVLRSEKTKI